MRGSDIRAVQGSCCELIKRALGGAGHASSHATAAAPLPRVQAAAAAPALRLWPTHRPAESSCAAATAGVVVVMLVSSSQNVPGGRLSGQRAACAPALREGHAGVQCAQRVKCGCRSSVVSGGPRRAGIRHVYAAPLIRSFLSAHQLCRPARQQRPGNAACCSGAPSIALLGWDAYVQVWVPKV